MEAYNQRLDKYSAIEIWKNITWYEWLYQVSNLWNVKSLRYNKILKTRLDKKRWNYVLCVLFDKKWVRKYKRLHRLVWLEFLENLNNYKEINHKDWNKLNNNVENLEWCNRSQNQLHNINILWNKTLFQTNNPNKWKTWIKNHLSKKVSQFDLKWFFIKTWDSISDIERELWLFHWNIYKCCTWKINHSGWFIWKYFNT